MAQLTPSMIKPGEHVVKLLDGDWYLVVKVGKQLIATNLEGYVNITDTSGSELSYGYDSDYGVIKVAELKNTRGTGSSSCYYPGDVVWERGESGEPNVFSKKDLKPGKHIVRLHHGSLALLLETADGDMFSTLHDRASCNRWKFSPLHEDMSCPGSTGYAIDEVYEITEPLGVPGLMKEGSSALKLVYNRAALVKEVTMAEVIAAFGQPVKIVEG